MKKCNGGTIRITRKKGAVEPIDMQKAFVEWAQGTWEGIARVLDFEKNDYKRRHCDRNWRPVRIRAAAARDRCSPVATAKPVLFEA